jgi:hypothetical protein
MTGQPTKMLITAYSDPKFKSKVPGAKNPFTVWVNPASYSYTRTVKYNDRQAQGAAGGSPEFNRVGDADLSFELVFDATGVIPLPTGQSYANGVTDIINDFIDLLATVNGDIHTPNYLIVGWAGLQFPGVLASMKIDFSLFRPDGTPLRAKMAVAFKYYSSEEMLAKAIKKNSPDMTHIVTVVAGDTLPALCYRIYGNSGYYARVAHFNRLLSFRDVAPGTELLFPPLSGSAPQQAPGSAT